ncbi:hypothetical protein ABIA32_000952 [Streptacidiphilus sp. MAP12-20]|uniref:DUF397 domain-containing protein n=1 Tax=Streptacidiphilus sp. MAP12-20 TaxID=3156299 RepID=UPI00351529D1
MRDSKDPDGPILRFSVAPWTDFLTSLRDGTLVRIDIDIDIDANVPPPVATAPSIR